MQKITLKSKKILFVFDKFKDTLSSREITQIVSSVIKQKFDEYNLKMVEIPISDGGDGFVECMHMGLSANDEVKKVEGVSVLDPLLREIKTSYVIDKKSDTKTAYLEVGNSSGLQLLNTSERNPFLASSIGTGQLINHCYYNENVRNIVVGSGGSAFVDGGIGAIQALGIFDFYDQNGDKINRHLRSADIPQVEKVDLVNPTLIKDLHFILPCDVQNPLTGESGAAYVFGPQKGAKPEDLPLLDQNMERIIKIYLRGIHQENYSDDLYYALAKTKGTGASGGFVAALLACFKNVQVISGMDYISSIFNLENLISESDLVFTGEGSFDSQTLEGKVVSKIHELTQKFNKPLIIICGINKLNELQMEKLLKENNQMKVYDLVSRYGIEKSLKHTASCLSDLTSNILIHEIKDYIV